MWPFRPRRRADNWMLTFSGVRYWPANPRAEDIRIVDIAHHLSRLCRYTGAIIPEHYSVAEHSVHVSHVVPPQFAFEGLMHDSPEYVLNDLNRPAKVDCPEYRRLEQRNWLVIAEKFGLPRELPPEVHEADIRVYLAERAALMTPAYDDDGYSRRYAPADVKILALSPNKAERLFLDRFYELTRGRKLPAHVRAIGSPIFRKVSPCVTG